jgi:hypothetical protein
VQQEAVSCVLKQRVAHHVHEEPVNRVVVAQELLVVSSVASAVGRFDELPQRCEVLGRCAIGNDVRDAALDRFAGLEHVQDVIEPERRHDGPPPWQHRDEPVGHEPGDCLAHRHASQSEIGGKRVLVDQRARRQPQVEDAFAELVIREVAGAWLPDRRGRLPAHGATRASAIKHTDTSRVSR